MRTIINIAKNELRQLFYSPIAWILLVIFFVQAGMAFSDVIGMLLRYRSLGFALSGITSQVFYDNWTGIYPNIQGYLFIYIPLLTMGLMSRDRISGADKLLLSSPVSNFQIVMGKFMSMAFYGAIMFSILVIQDIFCAVCVKTVDYGPMISGLAGLYLLMLAYSAIGIFMSSLTRYQIVSAVGTIASLFAISYITKVGQGVPVIREIAYWAGIAGRADTFILGMVCSEDLIYFIAVTALFLGLTIIKMNAASARLTGRSSAMAYAGIIAAFCAVGFISSRPSLKVYWDTTYNKACTLTEGSQEVMKQLDGPMTITTYVNLLANDFYTSAPKSYTRDVKRFEHYTRFKPEIKMKYVYYWHESEKYPLKNKEFRKLNGQEKAEKMARIQRVNLKRFLSPEQLGDIDAEYDLSGESYGFVRVIEGGPFGRSSRLRLYDDQEHHPGETEITAAMKRLVADVPVVGVLTGHGERDINSISDRGYFTFAKSSSFRHALMNQGFDIREVSVADGKVPEDISILMIADPISAFTQEETGRILDYIDAGGNLMVAGKPYNRKNLAPVMNALGLEFMDGTLVQQSSNYAQDLIIGDFTKESVKVSVGFLPYILKKMKLAGTGTMAIIDRNASEKGFNVHRLAVTDTTSCDTTKVWNELQVIDFENDRATFEPASGETLLDGAPFYMALDRSVGEKEQRVIVLGNADMIANGELMMSRSGVNAANYSIIMESFRYLSDGEFPVYMTREPGRDNELRFIDGKADRKRIKWIFNAILPALIGLMGIAVLIRRKSR